MRRDCDIPCGGDAEPADLDDDLRSVDRRVAAAGLEVWVGCEPTFTSRFAADPAWTFEALGADKEERAKRMLVALAERRPGALVMRPVGRQYPGEPLPRWCFALYERRDGRPLWSGPPDPLLHASPLEEAATTGELCTRFTAALVRVADEEGWGTARAESRDGARLGVILRADGAPPTADERVAARLDGLPLHCCPVRSQGLVDVLAEEGTWLLIVSHELHRRPDSGPDTAVTVLELPRVAAPAEFQHLLALVASAAVEAGLPVLNLRGYPPPVDADVALSTFTPDPAVLEINHAPAPDAATFAHAMREVFAAAGHAEVEPYRLRFDGTVADSGGAGHLTIGGPSPDASPFFVVPRLLPRLVRYLNRHPSLSYWFGPPYLGSSGQSPRTDESTRETFTELELALALLDREPAGDPALLARTIAPFLVDPSGNPHRSELNVEKLWNTALAGRGCLGLVELRAFGMARSADVLAARACLLRALIAMLARVELSRGLQRWGDDLHDRFALPFHLRRDLSAVAQDLAAAGFPLPRSLLDLLLEDEARVLGSATIDGCVIEIEQAVEFWPLVGDTASQETGGSRLVDASTARLQLTLRATAEADVPIGAWRLGAQGFAVRLNDEHDARGSLRLGAVRYRTFVPSGGLHPAVPALPKLCLTLRRAGAADALEVVVHAWRPDGAAYDGLPSSLEEAASRRRERVVARRVAARTLPVLAAPPSTAVSPWALDLRAV